MEFEYPKPKNAAAAILVTEDLAQVMWAQRNPAIPFLGGFHAFPGGKLELGDHSIKVENCDPETAPFVAACAREVFEEVGVLIVRNGDKLTKGQRASLHDDLISGRSTFGEILDDWGLKIDGRDFLDTGFWTTPPFSPVRFRTRFFLVVCPQRQSPYQAIDEMLGPVFIEPAKALESWSRYDVLIAPPTLVTLQEMASFKRDSNQGRDNELREIASALRRRSSAAEGSINSVEMGPRVICIPLRTKTLPPATHTNCFILGRREFVVIDAASREENELAKLFHIVGSLISNGGKCREIIVSHLHQDHFGGEMKLKQFISERFGLNVPIAAHRVTAECLREHVRVERFISDEEILTLSDADDVKFGIRALHTPGHARGHLCFYDDEYGFLLSSDNVVGTGTVVIAPPEGDMSDYLKSLRRMRELSGLKYLCGSHGAAVYDAKGKIDEYIAHRVDRERQVIAAIESGAKTATEIAKDIYSGIDPRIFPLAVESVRAHITKIQRDGLIRNSGVEY